MKPRILGWTMLVVGCLALSIALADPGADAAREAEMRALQAQIAQMDAQVRALSNRLYAIQTSAPADDPDVVAMRTQIRDISRDQAFLEARLRQLQGATAASESAPTPPRPPPTARSPVPSVAPVPQATPTPPAASPSPAGPRLREAADPAPYLKAVNQRVGMFFYNPYKLIPVGSSQLAIYTSFNEAYLLDLDGPCPALLTAKRITIENFSTRVIAGRHAVVADGTRCPIVGISTLHTNRLR